MVSLTRTPVVLAAALTLGITLAAAPAAAAAPQSAAVPAALVLPAAQRAVPRATQILTAGTSGFLWAQEGDDRLLWTDYTTGTAAALDQRLPTAVTYNVDDGSFRAAASFEPGWYGRGADTVALYEGGDAPHVTLLDKTRKVADVAVPAGHSYRGTFGGTVLTRTGGDGEHQTVHLWRDGTDTPVTGLPDGATDIAVEDGDARSVILRYKSSPDEPGWGRWSIVDLADGVAGALPDRMDENDTGFEVTGFQLGADSILRKRAGRAKLDVLDRKNINGPFRTVDTGPFAYDATYGIVGSTLLSVERVSPGNDLYRGQPLWAVPTDVDAPQLTKLMDPAANQIQQAPDGSAIVAGAERFVAEGDLDWGIYRISQGPGGSPERHRVTAVAPVPAQVHGLALGSGILSTADNSTIYQPGTYLGAYRSTWLTTPGPDATPAVARSSRDGFVSGRDGNCANDTTDGLRCVAMFADGTGYHGRRPATESGLTMLYANGAAAPGPSVHTGEDTPELVDLSGRYAVVNGVSFGNQNIVEFRPGAAGAVLVHRTPVGAAVWGSTLWSAAQTGGVVTATQLPGTGVMESFTTTNGCTPSSLQAVGRWVYWLCRDGFGDVHGAGIYDRAAKRTVTAPAGDVLLGDGYLVEHADGLRLIDLHDGLPASGNHADLPTRTLVGAAELGRFGGSRTSWTVDRFGGAVAYADDDQRVHIVPTGIPAGALTVIDSTVSPNAASWSGTWWLSKPAAAWQVVLRDRGGALIRTLSGSSAQGILKATWDGRDSAGRPVADGTFTWSLTAQPADGQGAALTVAGPPALKPGTKPSITGTAAVGSTVKATVGTWTPAATSYTYRWAANGATITGATSASYVIPPAMLGKRLTVTVTAKRTGYLSGTASSPSSAVIAKGPASKATRKPAVTGTARVGRTVRASVGTWSPGVTSYRYEWRLNGRVIAGRTGATLKLTSSMRGKKVTVTVIARRTGYQDGRATSKAVTARP
ncbi:FlgD immunoglobulin-like domain containing protein [Krasilnikovia sp. MM14-A1004]|uniref:FlgD immunoglobulin-like domain containing protein n=1 Tax=Krasilnikovia sp. MM14-A1004 TaxID=3373541 RepID=UPI00399CBABC